MKRRGAAVRAPDTDAPVGVFDSGIGGLTVVRSIMQRLPHESVVYFGDTARLPYGPKGPETVERYSLEVADFLRSEGVKALVVACNTATARALPALTAKLDFPVIGVIEPGARAAVKATRNRHVGVIATAGTVASGAYVRAIHAAASDVDVVALACPLFVPLVEEGWTEADATRLIAREYLEPFMPYREAGGRRPRPDTIVLGCTHYPLLKRVIGETVGRRIRLVDSAEETAAELAAVLRKRGLASGRADGSRYRFIVSDSPAQFLRVGQRFLGAPIDRVELRPIG
ncbi:MAG TPA: glutamate racemase [Gemmatimonadaceae bacterium]|nr:glutamate racemase [Gemmatimonadaceae bacterium]